MNWRTIENDKEKYQAYLCSREWAEKREAVRERAGDKCERCRTGPMDACHHLTYSRKYDEPLEDLQAICTPCHEFQEKLPFVVAIAKRMATSELDDIYRATGCSDLSDSAWFEPVEKD